MSLLEAQTTAVMVLTWIGLLVLSIIAAPLNRPRLLLIWSMAALFLVVLLTPATQKFFALEVAGRPGVARGVRHRGDRVVVRPVVRPGGAADRPAARVPGTSQDATQSAVD